jgi:hypothetical protein
MPKYYDFHKIFGKTKVPGCGISIRRKIFDELGGFKDIPNEDSVLSTDIRKLAKKKGYGKIKYIRNIRVKVDPRKILELGPIKIFFHYSKRGIKATKIQKNLEKKEK